MTKGITREEYRKMEAANATAGLESDYDIDQDTAISALEIVQDSFSPSKNIKINQLLLKSNPA